jgi:serralysin
MDIENLLGSKLDDSLAGDAGANRLDGWSGNDSLQGGGGADTLVGGAGRDLFVGGAGADVFTGGAGKDRYVYEAITDSASAAPDLITDLALEDRLLLTALDANVAKAGDQAFTLVAGFTGKAGQAVMSYDAGTNVSRLSLDVDGDGFADAAMLFTGNQTGFGNFAL